MWAWLWLWQGAGDVHRLQSVVTIVVVVVVVVVAGVVAEAVVVVAAVVVVEIAVVVVVVARSGGRSPAPKRGDDAGQGRVAGRCLDHGLHPGVASHHSQAVAGRVGGYEGGVEA